MILTARARIIVLMSVVSIVIGTLGEEFTTSFLGIALLVWFGYEFFVFRYWCDIAVPKASVQRQFRNERGVVRTFYTNRRYAIETSVRFRSAIGAVYVDVQDTTPGIAVFQRGKNRSQATAKDFGSIQMNYEIRSNQPGIAKFLGVQFHLQDLNGLFAATRFVSTADEVSVLPGVIRSGSLMPKTKHANELPPPGIHRQPRPGIGSELLEIREYVPGDPPKSIAWKLSAKRDTLLCKQYESEVPIRCTLLIDVSKSMRLGYPGPTSLAQVIDLAGTLVETIHAARDPVGVAFFDGQQNSVMQPSRNRKAIVEMFKRMADVGSVAHEPVDAPFDSFVPQAFDLAMQRYPKEMHESIPRVGFRLFPLSPTLRRRRRIRFQLSSVLAASHGNRAGMIGELMTDDQLFSNHLQRFLAENEIPYSGPVFNAKGRFHFSDPEKVSRLSNLLRYRVRKGIDNELFVIMIELTDVSNQLSTLIQSIRYAKARHHRVAVVSAWPPGYPKPRAEELDERPIDFEMATPREITQKSERRFRVNAFFAVKKQLSRLGVPLITATDETASQLLLSQLELVRAGRAAV